MPGFELVKNLSIAIDNVGSESDLYEVLARVTQEMGFSYFALVRHVDADRGGVASRVHNYPDPWVRYFEDHRLARNDPIHRASQRVVQGFLWNRVAAILPLNRSDKMHLESARQHGLANGYTVPANVPGETSGSCSFAVSSEMPVPEHHLALAQLVGIFALEAARKLKSNRQSSASASLTRRQSDCVLWAARGKTDWEIAQILGIAHETVIRHLKYARERYDVQKRASLVVRALHDGLFSFSDILEFIHLN